MRDRQLAKNASCTFRSRMRRLLAPFVCLLLVSTSLSADSLSDIVQLAQKGATQLALQQLDTQQPNPLDEPEQWLNWERQRIALYQQAKQWRALIKRIDEQRGFIELAYRDWFASQQAEALLEIGQGSKARSIYRTLIWTRETPADAQSLQQWRAAIVRSYLIDQQANDAHAAMLRNAQDYPSDTSESNVLLRARVLLLAERANDAAELLADKKTSNAKTLYLLAALRSARLPASDVIRKINAILKKKKLLKENRIRLLAIKAEASQTESETGQAVAAIESYLRLTRRESLDDGLLHLDGDQLWQAYQQHGKKIGNKQQLLLGDDASWFNAAKKIKKKPLQQRSLYAVLALTSRSPESQNKAHELLINSLRVNDSGIEVIRHLYLNSHKILQNQELPALARYSLLEQALKESDIKLASQLMQGLAHAPEGINPLFWELRRARVFVMAGKPDEATVVLNEVLENQSLANKETIDRFIQVVFDLQTIEAHEQAYNLFAGLLKKVDFPKIRRELYYWMAESRKAQRRYADAAALYLRSSESNVLPQPDLWAQSSMYQAAQALGEAGLIEDATRLYKKLLRITRDEARRGQLQRRLQQLWLKRGKSPA